MIAGNLEELKRLAAEVSAAHGIRLDVDDPMMAVITLNRLVLEQVLSNFVKALTEATRELGDAGERVQARAGVVIAEELKVQIELVRRALQVEIDPLRIPDQSPIQHRQRLPWITAGLLSALALLAAGVYLGTFIA